MRNVGAVLAGLIAGCLALVLVSLIGGSAFPVEARINVRDAGQVRSIFADLPVQLKLVLVAAWFAAALVGGLAARWIGTRAWPVWTVAILFALYVLMNIAVLPMPAWMQAASLLAPLIGGAIAHHYGPRPAAPAAELDDDGA